MKTSTCAEGLPSPFAKYMKLGLPRVACGAAPARRRASHSLEKEREALSSPSLLRPLSNKPFSLKLKFEYLLSLLH